MKKYKLKNQCVTHISLGAGKVVNQDDGYITVRFNNDDKIFVYPSAFDHFLTADNAELQEQIQMIIAKDKEDIQQLQKLDDQQEALRSSLQKQRSLPKKVVRKKKTVAVTAE